MPLPRDEQDRLRADLFAACTAFVERRGGFVSRDELVNFELRGQRIGLIDRNRGIRNPAELDETLSIVSSPEGPYSDEVALDGVLHYDFAPGPLRAGDNRKMLAAFEARTPLILFQKPMPNVYLPTLPVYVINIVEERRKFIIATSGEVRSRGELLQADDFERRYREQLVRQRVHQPAFRARVLVAYQRSCAVCRLNHPELLDAAHIVPDAHEQGIASVTNGLALCKIHHSAYDQNLIGVDADYTMHVNQALLEERDGPMLLHGFQELDRSEIQVPRQRGLRPSRDGLAFRFEQFLSA
ncbi:HNH endonuclease [Schumannella luteola]|uniref:Putative restriction endonuclease n=1 Tax=Schumannella luteola TaxID=472059 RepID=A0A852YA73_9MICO|nr:HNH endonuclease [Schumannella luteola]NYG99373.1 putative restriction endonuclease [Schumannella luteola]TPX06100.1 restriction endonuclease [Schumannella luteola]